MSNPDTAALDEFPEDVEEQASTGKPSFDAAEYEKQVNEAVTNMTQDDDGKWHLPEGLSPELEFAANTERRRRDTQASYTKTQQALRVAETKTLKLTERLENSIKPNLTVEQSEELEDLKESDAEAWREKLNEYDAEAYGKYEEDIADIDSTANQAAEEERRTEVLTQFITDNPDIVLNDHVFENDLPPRITGKLEKGEISFENFLEEAKEYLTKGKKIATADPGKEEPDLSKSSGTNRATDKVVDADATEAYENEIF